MELPRPRAYADWTVPRDSDGNPIGICKDPGTYAVYISWLATYLFETNIPMPPNQKSLFEKYQKKDPLHAVLDLSNALGYSLWDTETLEDAWMEGQPYSATHEVEMNAFLDLGAEERAEWELEDFLTSEEDYNRLGREKEASLKIPPYIQHADIPYRPVLAALFKKIPEHNKRSELLDFYYRNFGECASK